MQYTGIVSYVNIDRNANYYNDNYYNSLYNQKETEYVSKQININKHLNQPYNEEEFRESFKKIHHGSIINYKEIIPNNIMEKVADLRVFALGVVSQEVYDLLTERKVLFDKLNNEYRKYYNSISNEIIGTNLEVLDNLHDAVIENSKSHNQDLILKIDSSGSFAKVKEIIFKKSLCNPENFQFLNHCWLYNEFYFLDNKIRIDILLADENNDLFEVTIIFDNVIINQ